MSKADTLGPIYMNSLPHMFMQPEVVADAVAYLASDDARYMTGSEFVIDMGNTAR